MDGELVVINLQNGRYYASGGAGPAAWLLLDRGVAVMDVAAAIAAHYALSPEIARADVTAFVRKLETEALIVAADAPTERADGTFPDGILGGYAAPTLTTFDDMEQAFALDPPLRP
jgi:hypothetical protein